MITKNPTIRDIVITEMRLQKITQSTLAELVSRRSEFSRDTIHRWIRGASEIGDRKLAVILDILKLKIKH